MSLPVETLSDHSPTMDQQSDHQPDESLPQGSMESAHYFLIPVEPPGSMEIANSFLILVKPLGSTEIANYLDIVAEELKKLSEFLASQNWDFLGLEKIERIGGVPAFYPDFSDEDIANMPTGGLHALLQDKSLPNILRDKIKGELAVRSIAKLKGKTVATSSYDTGESSSNTSSLNSPIPEEIPQRSELDHASFPLAVMADHGDYAGAGASRRSLNGRTEGTVVSWDRGSQESAAQRYLLPHPPLPASRNGQAPLKQSNAKCKDNHNVGRAGTTVFSLEPTVHCHQSAACAAPGADIEAGGGGTTVFSPEQTAYHQQSAAHARTGANMHAGEFNNCLEPPPETVAIFKEPPAGILIAGAFALLSRDPETFKGPVERVLLGVMTVGFISNFMLLLIGGRRRARVSSFFQWAAVWATFVAFFLIMALLITN